MVEIDKLKNELKEKIDRVQEETKNLGKQIAEIDTSVKANAAKGTPSSTEEVPNPTTVENSNAKKKTKSAKTRVTWIGTSLSRGLEKEKFEKDTETKLTVRKAYCVKEADLEIMVDPGSPTPSDNLGCQKLFD